jgi:hypothetical protein
MKPAATIASIALVLLLAGCASVQPWEKGKLAKPEMTFGGARLETRYADHVYTSREAASGGAGVGGGGCGCN